MNTWHVPPTERDRERGQALAFVGIAMIMLVALAVIGVDVGRLAFTASEVQSIADAAATAAAGAIGAHENDPLAVATAVVRQNYVDARTGNVGSATTDVVKSITPGVWDFSARTFKASTWNDPLVNSARVRAVATVDNLLAAAIGFAQSDVERQATAAAGGACTEVLALPIAIEKDAIQQFLDSADCRTTSVTRLFQVPTDNSCFTSLSADSASASTEKSLIPICGGGGGGGKTQSVSIGDSINLDNGQQSTVLQALDDCVKAGQNEFVVPVIGDGSCGSHPSNVVAFARIIIDHVQTTGASNQKGVYIKGVCRETVSGTNPGCLTGGENAMAIVQ